MNDFEKLCHRFVDGFVSGVGELGLFANVEQTAPELKRLGIAAHTHSYRRRHTSRSRSRQRIRNRRGPSQSWSPVFSAAEDTSQRGSWELK